MKTLFHWRNLACMVGVAVLTGSVASVVKTRKESGPTPAANLAPADRGVITFGHVDVENGVTSLYPAQPGRVVSVQVKENEEVGAGAEILRLDDEFARHRVQEAEADLEAARAMLDQAHKAPEQQQTRLAQQRAALEAMRHRLAAARLTLEKKQDLAVKKLIPSAEPDVAEELVKEAEAGVQAEEQKLKELGLLDPQVEVRRAEANLSAKEAQLAEAQLALRECVLRAPSAGQVLRVLVSPGDMLGSQPRMPAVLFCPAGPRIVRAEVEQEFAGRVAVGQAVTIRDDSAAATTTWHGKVVRMSDWYTQRRSVLQEPLQFNDVRTKECLIVLDPGQELLSIGQRVRVFIGKQPSEN
jgi:multidrug resistance efflux pump